MKFLVAVLPVLFLSSAVFAIPAIGDYAKYALTLTSNGQTQNGTLEYTLTAYDQASDTYTEHVVITDQNGNASPSDQAVASSNLLGDAVFSNLTAECTNAGGTMGSTTVSAGTFNTCNLPVSGNGSTGTIWVGAVPFGVVQSSVVQSGTTVALSLQAYTVGK